MGRNSFSRWFYSLDGVAQSEISTKLGRIADGNLSSMKGVGHGVHEIRSNFGPGYRVYCGKDGETLVILLGGGTKKRQQDDIDAAKALWQEYKQRKREEK
jgi:putative addiction module killer protein